MNYKVEEEIIKIENLSLSYGPKQIFRDLNLSINNITRPGMQQGQIVSLLGPSGIGKTQLFRCIAGLQKQTTGAVTLYQKPIKVGDVGVVFQSYPLLKHRTVLGNLKIAADHGNKTEAQINELLQRFDLMDKKKLYPVQLSGGQRQRVAIIQQLLCSSNVILMDEPFSGLDVIMKHKAIDLIREVSMVDEHNTIVITTHDIETAVAISDEIWILGRQKNADGSWAPGSTIMKEIDLKKIGLAWQPQIEKHEMFWPTVTKIKDFFTEI